MTTPIQRISRLLNEGARFMVQIPGSVSIDLTPDVIAALAEVQNPDRGFEHERNLFEPAASCGDLRTCVQFP
jgi:hypothetical protein